MEYEDLVFIRQIKDFYRYRRQGNIFLSFFLPFQKLATEKLLIGIQKFLAYRPVLNTVFEEDARRGLLQRVVAPEIDDSWINTISGLPMVAALAQAEKALARVRLTEGPLIHFYWIEATDRPNSQLYVYVHHIICNGASLRILKDDFVKAYRDELTSPVCASPFIAYSRYANERALRQYDKTYAFLERNIGPYLSSNGRDFSNLCVDEAVRLVTELERDYTIDDGDWPAIEGKQCQTVQHLARPTHELKADLTRYQLNWQSIMLTAYCRAINQCINDTMTVGLILEDRFNRHSYGAVGEFTGENFVASRQFREDSLLAIKQTAGLLRDLSRNAIFNYRFYGVDELNLYKNCFGFFNFSLVEGSPAEPNTQVGIFVPLNNYIGCHAEPLITLYADGTLEVVWRFNRLLLPEGKVTELSEKFHHNINFILNSFQ